MRTVLVSCLGVPLSSHLLPLSPLASALNDINKLVQEFAGARALLGESTAAMEQRIAAETARQEAMHPGESPDERRERWRAESAERMTDRARDLRPNPNWLRAHGVQVPMHLQSPAAAASPSDGASPAAVA